MTLGELQKIFENEFDTFFMSSSFLMERNRELGVRKALSAVLDALEGSVAATWRDARDGCTCVACMRDGHAAARRWRNQFTESNDNG